MKIDLLLSRLNKFSHAVRSKQLLKALVSYGVLAGAEHRNVLQKKPAMVVDIGANRGQFALAARRWASSAIIVCFEPLNAAAATFRDVFKQDPVTTLHQTAIGPQAGETNIHVAAADDSSSLLPISPLQERLFPGTQEIRTEIVKVARLSDYVQPEQIVPPAMLKLDVQGYELEALRGCEDLLGRFSYVYVECSFVELYTGQALVDDIMAWLRNRGWRLGGIYNMTYDRDGRSIQADFLFEKSSRLQNE
jgi:FkbM family methyltransferase